MKKYKSNSLAKSSSLGEIGENAKILIIQQKMIGDVLTSTILCEAIKKEHPSATVHYLVNAHTVPVVEHHPYIDKLIVFQPETEKSIKLFYKFLQHIKAQKYDAVIDVYGKLSSALMTVFSKAKLKIGYKKKKYSTLLYTHRYSTELVRNKSVGLAYENRLRLLQPLIKNIDYQLSPTIVLHPSEKEQLLQKLKTHQIEIAEKKYIMVNILGSAAEKTYPLPFMANLLDRIVEQFPEVHLLLNYIPKQKEEVTRLISHCQPLTRNHILDFYAPSLREFIVLTSFCTMVIGNEGGAINIGKALQIPSFAIFSPWIRKETWGVPEEETIHKTVHLKDYKPELFDNYTQKKFKEKAIILYQEFKPKYFEQTMLNFVHKHLNS